jgi:DNA primase small subunit
MQRREFGFLLFREKVMVRHKAFQDIPALGATIINLGPSDIYYSTAYYEHPDMNIMVQKGWKGSDLVFDIDADHFDTPCKKKHDMWTCLSCKENGKGRKPAKCPKCGYEKLEEKAWLCDVCLDAAKDEMFKLFDFLTADFGVQLHDMHLFFSGHRGYHLHISSEDLISLTEMQRKKVVDYVVGLGFDAAMQGLYKDFLGGRSPVIVGPQYTDPGWRGRLAKGVYKIMTEFDEGQLTDAGFTKKAALQIVKERPKIRVDWSKSIRWSALQDRWKIDDVAWKKIIEKALLVSLPAKIDTVVTTDIHRLIRMANTLNGKTGFKASAIAIDKLKAFDPFTDPIVFEGTLKVAVKNAPEFRIRNERFGPYKNETVEIPAAAAILLVAKDVATI